MQAREKSWFEMYQAEQQVQRKKEALEKINGTSRIRTDKIEELQNEIEVAEKQVFVVKEDFIKVDKTLKEEWIRFEEDRIKDSLVSLKRFFSSLIQTQKEVSLFCVGVDSSQCVS